MGRFLSKFVSVRGFTELFESTLVEVFNVYLPLFLCMCFFRFALKMSFYNR